MTAMRISEIVHGWLGWCPDRDSIIVRKRVLSHGMKSQSLPAEGTYVNEGVIVDCGTTGISLRFFTGALLGVVGVIALYILLIPTLPLTFAAGFLLISLILLVGIVMVYRDRKGATIEITPDSLTIRRFLHPPFIIRKDTIETAELQKYVPLSPSWLPAALMLLLVPVLSAGVIWGQYLELIAGGMSAMSFFVRLGFDICVVLFFFAAYQHSRIRSAYSEILAIRTTSNQIAVIYSKHPEELAEKLGRSL